MLYKLPNDTYFGTNLRLKNCYKSKDDMFSISSTGDISIKKDFLWNGATFWREGKLTTLKDANGKLLPYSWRATILHDACYKYLSSDITFPLSRKRVDRLLKDTLDKYSNYTLIERHLIYYGVRIFGRFFSNTSGKSPLIETPGTIRLGSPYVVRNSHKLGNESKEYVWIKIQRSDDTHEQWLAFPKKQIQKAKDRANKNKVDQPKENTIMDFLT